MIAGILLLVNPRTPHAPEMKEIVRLFKQEHPYDPKADDFTQKEATIVRFPVKTKRATDLTGRLQPLMNVESSSNRDGLHLGSGRRARRLLSETRGNLDLQRVHCNRLTNPATLRLPRLPIPHPYCKVQMTIRLSQCTFLLSLHRLTSLQAQHVDVPTAGPSRPGRR